MLLRIIFTHFVVLIIPGLALAAEAGKIHFIVNPAAGGGMCERKFHRVEQILNQSGIDYAVHTTTDSDQADSIVRRLIKNKELAPYKGAVSGSALTKVVAVGGDGTYSQVADEIRKESLGYAIGILPFGTGNDTARALGIPVASRRVSEAVDIIINTQRKQLMGAYRLVFPDRKDKNNEAFEKWAFQEVDTGFSTNVGRRKANGETVCCFTGGYTALALTEAMHWQPICLKIYQGGRPLAAYPQGLLVALTTGGYFGGGYNVTPGTNLRGKADNKYGQLVCLYGMTGLFNILPYMFTVKRGRHVDDTQFCYSLTLEEHEQGQGNKNLIRIEAPDVRPPLFQEVAIDGELRNYHLPVEITWHPRQVTVLAPWERSQSGI